MRDKELYQIGDLANYLDGESFGLLLDTANAKYNKAAWRKYAAWGEPTIDREWKQGKKSVPIMVRASVLGTNSEKPQRNTEGWGAYGGTMPQIGHGFSIDKSDLIELRKLSALKDKPFGDSMIDCFIQNSENMIGGIHTELSYMVYQAMSTGQILDIAVDGYQYDFKFPIPDENFVSCDTGKNWFNANGTPNENADIIQDFLDFQDYYTDELNLDVDHWKVSKKLLKMILRHPSVVKAYCANKNYFNPDEVKVDRDELLKWMHDSMDIWAFDVVDYKSRHEEDGKPVLDDPAFDEHNLVAASRKYRMFEMKCMEPITKPRQGMGGLTAADLYHFVEGRISVLNSWTERPIQNVVDCELFAGPVFNNVNNVGIATVWEE